MYNRTYFENPEFISGYRVFINTRRYYKYFSLFDSQRFLTSSCRKKIIYHPPYVNSHIHTHTSILNAIAHHADDNCQSNMLIP